MGLEDELAHSSLRFTFGRFSTEEEVDYAAGQLRDVVLKLSQKSA